MTIIVQIALFFAGMYVSMRMIAALFRIVDLWYTINTAYPRMIRGVLGWGAVMAIMIVMLGGVLLTSFLFGLAVFSFLYLMGWPINWLLRRRTFRSSFPS
jgi:hypothetical protein